ncbi:hypothetical protein SAMN02745148_03243 [Modicisalibacter ilicicola DSM 19980]|uniref:Uncharacterized protein n=2 Tax=Oceanospirillales TaxID=135619 RepID=A0A1M5DHE9_9GAMM|nr:hypothetical protein SAMN02745148_03243 [Halomonas ilicicola DSM 19980]
MPLWSKLGDKKEWHFAHAPNYTDCGSGAETGIHLAAKQLILNESAIAIPELSVNCTLNDLNGKEHTKHRKLLDKSQRCDVYNAQPEVRLATIVADLCVEDKEGQLLIEIAVNHFVDSAKFDKIASLGIRCIEIDLSKVNRNCTLHELKAHIFDPDNSLWVFHPECVRWTRLLSMDLKAEVNAINKQIEKFMRLAKDKGSSRYANHAADDATQYHTPTNADELAEQIWRKKFYRHSWYRRR